MKIALICTEKLPIPPVAGGAVQLYIDGIAPFLAAKHDITVFSIQYPGLPAKETIGSIKHIRLPGGTNTIYINSLKGALDRSFDLIHVFNRPRYILELMQVLPDVRFSLSLHNEMFHPEKITDEDALRCIKKVEFINTVSRYIADTVKARFPQAAEKLRVVYSGADTQSYKPAWSPEGRRDRLALKEKYGVQDRKIVLFVGRFSPKKGVHLLIDAVKKVMLTNPGIVLVIVGSKWYGSNDVDDYTKTLQASAKLLPGRVIFTGFLPPDQVCRYYSMADVFVCASQWNEPLARVHYEAMAAGLPIITTNRGGNAEVINGFGNGIVLEDYSNAESMANSISYLLSSPSKCQEMGKRGRAMAEQYFNWERVAGEVFPAGCVAPVKCITHKLAAPASPMATVPVSGPVTVPVLQPPAAAITAVQPTATSAVHVTSAAAAPAISVAATTTTKPPKTTASSVVPATSAAPAITATSTAPAATTTIAAATNKPNRGWNKNIRIYPEA